MTPVLESARLRLRPVDVDDAEALFEAYSDVALMRYWSSAPHASVEETRAYLAGRDAARPWRGWAITRKGSDRAIGTVFTGEIRAGAAEIGYLLARAHWGSGIAREAVTRVLDLLLVTEDWRRIEADTDPDNAASNALLGKLGFTQEGRLRAAWETHIGVRDSFIWGLLRDEWRSVERAVAASK
ncbi:GNAT family N-acetyltransferase [Sphingomonas sp.]|uniref:GNAT family N-acetyltransferase n=1 Tax=Sphingomonas sp. TaxID=28214 RepID=UPI0025EEDFDB|nr:GNAT family N-acetyltransferase [Sphingomonas sp.]